jgi:hypothetical protein
VAVSCEDLDFQSHTCMPWSIFVCSIVWGESWLFVMLISVKQWYTYHSDLSLYVSVCIVSVWLRRVIHLSQWFITLCLCLYCISMTKKSDTPITVIYHTLFLAILIQYRQRHRVINHCDRCITLLDHTDTVQTET